MNQVEKIMKNKIKIYLEADWIPISAQNGEEMHLNH